LQYLAVAIKPGDFWHAIAEMVHTYSLENYKELKKIYGRGKDEVDLSPFFNLLVVHELAHMFHHTGFSENDPKGLEPFFAKKLLQIEI